MNECIDCKYYRNKATYPGSGFCMLWQDYLLDSDGCEEFEEKEDES